MSCNPNKQTLLFVNKSPNPNPAYAKAGDSGFDLRAWIQEEESGCSMSEEKPCIIIPPGRNKLIHTGLYFQLPPFTELQVRPRSGLALKLAITVTNSPGTVDEGYRNEVGVIIENHGQEDFVIETGDRIAQAVLCPVFNSYLVDLKQTDHIAADTERGLGGFGHSGIE